MRSDGPDADVENVGDDLVGEALADHVRDFALARAEGRRVGRARAEQAEADQRAKAILNDHAKQFVTGEAECVGLPELRPDRNVRLENLGDPFTKTYYIQQTTHKVDGSGYRTRVKVKETTL